MVYVRRSWHDATRTGSKGNSNRPQRLIRGGGQHGHDPRRRGGHPAPQSHSGGRLGDRVADKPAPTGQHGPRLRRALDLRGGGPAPSPGKVGHQDPAWRVRGHGELLLEFWASTREDDQPKQEAKA